MKINTTIIEGKEKLKFPLLARLKPTSENAGDAAGMVVLLFKEGVGVVVVGAAHPVGEFSDNWVDLNEKNWEILPAGSEVSFVQE